MKVNAREIDLSNFNIPRVDNGEPDWEAIAARITQDMGQEQAVGAKAKIIGNLPVDKDRFLNSIIELYGAKRPATPRQQQAQVQESPLSAVRHIRIGYTTMTGIPIEEIAVALDRPYPKYMYKPVPGRKDMHDINPTATLERLNSVFGMPGYGWTIKQTSTPKVEYVSASKLSDGKADQKSDGWLAQIAGEFVYMMISGVEGVDNSMSLGVPIFAAYFVPDIQKNARAPQDASRGLTTVMYGAIIKALTNFAHMNTGYEGENYDYDAFNGAQ